MTTERTEPKRQPEKSRPAETPLRDLPAPEREADDARGGGVGPPVAVVIVF